MCVCVCVYKDWLQATTCWNATQRSNSTEHEPAAPIFNREIKRYLKKERRKNPLAIPYNHGDYNIFIARHNSLSACLPAFSRLGCIFTSDTCPDLIMILFFFFFLRAPFRFFNECRSHDAHQRRPPSLLSSWTNHPAKSSKEKDGAGSP